MSKQDAMPPPATPAVAKTAPTGAGLTGPSPDKMTFSAKKRFFEKEIEETVTPAVKPGHFYFPLLITTTKIFILKTLPDFN